MNITYYQEEHRGYLGVAGNGARTALAGEIAACRRLAPRGGSEETAPRPRLGRA